MRFTSTFFDRIREVLQTSEEEADKELMDVLVLLSDPCDGILQNSEVGELSVYEPHPFKVAELNEYQQGGTFSFIYVAGLNGYSDTANWETHINASGKLFVARNRSSGIVYCGNRNYLTHFAPLNSLCSDGVYGRLYGQNPASQLIWEAGFS